MMQGSPAFLCENRRSAIGRYGGVLSGVRPDDLAAQVMAATLAAAPQVDPAAIDEVILGCANQAGEDNRNVARMASLLAGMPESVPGITVNRLCASGLSAVALAARAIACGEADLVLAGGVESMSRAPYVMAKPAAAWSRTPQVHDTTIGWRFVNAELERQYGVDSMPETAENVAAAYGISREDQDAFAVRSQERTARACAAGRLAEEIAPVQLPGQRGDPAIIDRDEHPRPATTREQLAQLPAPFRQGGTVTAGNASGVNDGAAAMFIASERAVAQHGLTPLARITATASAGVAPRLMGMGPVEAVNRLCTRLSLAPGDFDVVELNEAFAAQALAVLRQLGIDDDAEHVNPNGGAIALGHPLGMSGARLAMTAARELHRRGGRRALATLCVGVGQGVAVSFEAAA
ncbi:3-oxoadipyl-CoA thiolase [Pelagerythrobacter marensis]|uniref:Beta-ketoadipyl-CoA thiolase n=1 Tax=Pelagerythrobacter marensis TaxID=543877 RepID=A0A0G3X674_9SPHN|nr:beta-ketoadipyl CoA thiolase [Pelagerythrobacter marensis]